MLLVFTRLLVFTSTSIVGVACVEYSRVRIISPVEMTYGSAFPSLHHLGRGSVPYGWENVQDECKTAAVSVHFQSLLILRKRRPIS